MYIETYYASVLYGTFSQLLELKAFLDSIKHEIVLPLVIALFLMDILWKKWGKASGQTFYNFRASKFFYWRIVYS